MSSRGRIRAARVNERRSLLGRAPLISHVPPAAASQQVSTHTFTVSGQVERAAHALFSDQTLSRDDLAAVAGAPPGAKVALRGTVMFNDDRHSTLHVDWVSADGAVRTQTYIARGPDGRLVLNGVDMVSDGARAQRGVGAVMLARQVQAARRFGIDRIETEANNPYVWARYGFRGNIVERGENPNQTMLPHIMDVARTGIWRDRDGRAHYLDTESQAALHRAATQNDVTYLMDALGARAWYKANVATGFHGVFDIRDRRSLDLLDWALREQGLSLHAVE